MIFRFYKTIDCFLKYINKILAKKLYVLIIIELDNILIYTKNKSQNLVTIV